MKTSKAHIESIRIERVVDTDPDTSYLGEYSDKPGQSDRTIDRAERGDQRRNELRYFIAAMSGKETGNRLSVEQDYKRIEQLYRGDWCYVGIIAKAVVVSAQGVIQTLRSGGLWGIESDSGDDYLAEVAKEELSALRSKLESFGFGSRSIDHAFKSVEHRND